MFSKTFKKKKIKKIEVYQAEISISNHVFVTIGIFGRLEDNYYTFKLEVNESKPKVIDYCNKTYVE